MTIATAIPEDMIACPAVLYEKNGQWYTGCGTPVSPPEFVNDPEYIKRQEWIRTLTPVLTPPPVGTTPIEDRAKTGLVPGTAPGTVMDATTQVGGVGGVALIAAAVVAWMFLSGGKH